MTYDAGVDMEDFESGVLWRDVLGMPYLCLKSNINSFLNPVCCRFWLLSDAHEETIYRPIYRQAIDCLRYR